MADHHDKTDVVIVGGGLAGIVAAYELLEAGKRVAILERDVPERFGGLAKESFGGIFFVGSQHQKRLGIKDNVDLALRDWHSFAEFGPEDHWPKKWAEQYVHQCTDHVYHWLRQKKIGFFPVVHWVERGLLEPGNSVPRFHMVWGTGHALAMGMIHQLQNHANAGKLKLHFNHRVETLLSGHNGVFGVKGVKEGSSEQFQMEGENVVVATGGISGNLDRVRKEWFKGWGAPPKEMLNGSHRFADGLLHDAAASLDANITHLDKQWNYAAGVHHPNPDKPEHGLSIVPPKSAIWVDATGKRFGPMPLVSAYDTRYLVQEIAKSEHQYSWQILNKKIALKELAVSGSQYNDAIREKDLIGFLKVILLGNKKLYNSLTGGCIDFVLGNSIEELAEKMNALTGKNLVEVAQLKASILQYDQNIDRGPKYHNDEQLRRIRHLRQYRGDKVRTMKNAKIVDSKSLPLVAIREFILSRKSLGGIQTDLEGRVLSIPNNGKQEAIPGLYAIGEAAGFGGGGIHGLRSLEGTFLGSCILTGRIAGRSIAGKKL